MKSKPDPVQQVVPADTASSRSGVRCGECAVRADVAALRQDMSNWIRAARMARAAFKRARAGLSVVLIDARIEALRDFGKLLPRSAATGANSALSDGGTGT